MQVKLAGIGILSLFLVMLVPVYAEITEFSIEKSFYTIEENIVFVGTTDEKNTMINVILENPNEKESVIGFNYTSIFDTNGVSCVYMDNEEVYNDFTKLHKGTHAINRLSGNVDRWGVLFPITSKLWFAPMVYKGEIQVTKIGMLDPLFPCCHIC